MSDKKSSFRHSGFDALKNHVVPVVQQKPAKKVEPTVVLPKHHQKMSDAELFAAAVGNVQKFDSSITKKRVLPEERLKQKQAKDAERLYDEQNAVNELHQMMPDKQGFRLLEQADSSFTGQAPGVSDLLLKQLAQRLFAPQATLDLHGYTEDMAQQQVAQFIHQSRKQDCRCVVIVTGYGKNSPGGLAILKDALPYWLAASPLSRHVLAFCLAQPQDGGPGAYYVLLKK